MVFRPESLGFTREENIWETKAIWKNALAFKRIFRKISLKIF